MVFGPNEGGMKYSLGNLVHNLEPCYVRVSPQLGGEVKRYESNTLFTIIDVNVDWRYFVKVLCPNGHVGFLHMEKGNIEVSGW